jgi:ABC-2 type transport system ATP-binding protein
LFGYVGQDTDRSGYPRLTVKENMRFFGSLHGLDKKQLDKQIEKLTHYFDFHDNINKWFTHLSGGQKQTVVIMRALLHDPPIIYLDEPTKGLDPIVAKRIRNFLVQYVREEKKAVLLTSHILSEVDEMANRIALIHAGVIPITSTSSALKGTIGAETFIELQSDSIGPDIKEQIMRIDSVLLCLDREPGWISFGLSNVFDGTESILHILRENNIKTLLRHHNVSLEDAYIYHIGTMIDRFEK